MQYLFQSIANSYGRTTSVSIKIGMRPRLSLRKADRTVCVASRAQNLITLDEIAAEEKAFTCDASPVRAVSSNHISGSSKGLQFLLAPAWSGEALAIFATGVCDDRGSQTWDLEFKQGDPYGFHHYNERTLERATGGTKHLLALKSREADRL